ncbi:hypothetical protein B0J17DRAFT_723578 [Rhizoctonia solani]|nr:hypothetical protein B0J17DRAFT_723578 [Rhizoctonia solani]
MLNRKIQPFLDELIRDRKKELQMLSEQDSHSTHNYLTEKGYPQSVIDYIETMCFGTGGYDRVLAETVLKELCFRYNQNDPEDLNWKRVGSRHRPLSYLMQGRGTPEEARLKELMLADIAYIHNEDRTTIDFLREQFQNIFPCTPNMMPSVFSDPANSKNSTVHLHVLLLKETCISSERPLYDPWMGCRGTRERGAGSLPDAQAPQDGHFERGHSHNALKDSKAESSPKLGFNKVLLKLQLCISMKLQIEEFHIIGGEGRQETL